jgi:hypothetical protein
MNASPSVTNESNSTQNGKNILPQNAQKTHKKNDLIYFKKAFLCAFCDFCG